MQLQSTDYYTIKLNTSHGYDDMMYLHLLYQPIVGHGAIALYNTFRSELYKSTKISGLCSHYRLCSLMDCSLEQLIHYKKRLEAVGLIKTYVKSHRDAMLYFYEIYSPIEAKQFFENPVLHGLLVKQMSDYDYEQTLTLFKTPQVRMKDELTDISASFKEVFNVHTDKPYDSNAQLVSSVQATINHGIDFDFIINELKVNYIPVNVLTDNVKNTLIQLASLYQLSENHLVKLILFSYDQHQIDVEKLSLQALNLYTLESYQRPVEAALKAPQKRVTHDFREDFINYSPVAFLTLKYHNAKPPRKDIKLLDELMTNFKLKSEVVNVIVDYVLRVNDGKLTAAFVQSIAASFAAKQVNDLDRAMIILKKAHQKQKAQPKQRKARKEVVENYEKTDAKNDSEEALKEIADMINSL